jgi:Uncharacterized conserved protein (DUF2075).
MSRAFYSNEISNLLKQSENEILGELAHNNPFELNNFQRNAWIEEIKIFKNAFSPNDRGYIILEYTIPRIGNRIDAVYILDGLIFLIEFKVGDREYTKYAIDQVTDYALDLKNFHKASHERLLIPILIATEAPTEPIVCKKMKDGILEVIKCNRENIAEAISIVSANYTEAKIQAQEWMNSPYVPTPTIIEAAQALYRGHAVSDISRNDASAVNLNQTTKAINEIIEKSKREHKKSICFVTGVPGAGKTLAGLNIANERHKFDESEHAVFLSGNQPLVDVLQEALARDEHERLNVKKMEAIAKAKSFIQIIHHFRDDAISTIEAPNEKVAIFDEAQRAWTEEMLSKFMAQKKGKPNFNMSEPEFLISIMDRHTDWAVIICLIGGGQEINTGEAGLIEWFNTLKKDFKNWDIYISDKITESEYTKGLTKAEFIGELQYKTIEELHLSVSLRSFRSENVAGFVKAILDVDTKTASELYNSLSKEYPIRITRDLEKAKLWIKSQAKGTERYGITASSGARRLRSYGIWVQSEVDAKNWFLNDFNDVRSSYFLEDTATEFDIQGLELDWTIVCWDANLRFVKDHFEHYSFKGSKWMRINKPEDKLYLKNAYRVLLTRARQGMIIFIPHGSETDSTRPHEYYDGIYNYLKNIGLQET